MDEIEVVQVSNSRNKQAEQNPSDKMAKKVFSAVLMVTIAGLCFGEPSTGGYGAPSHSGAGADSAPNYHFGYGVFDPQTGSDFMHEEERNNQAVKGQYRVNLPDGRIQVVTYTADENGYRAEVTYQDVKTGSNAATSQSSYSSLGTTSNAAVGGGYGPPQATVPVLAPRPAVASSRSNGRNYHRVRATVAGQQYQYGY